MLGLCAASWLGLVLAGLYKSDGRSWGGERLAPRMFYWLFVAMLCSIGTRRRYWSVRQDSGSLTGWQVGLLASALVLAVDVTWSFVISVLILDGELGSVLGYPVVAAALAAPLSLYLGSRKTSSSGPSAT